MQSYLTIDKVKQKQFYSIRKTYLPCLVTKTTSLLYFEIRYSIYKYTVASSARLVTSALPVADSTPGSLSMQELVRTNIPISQPCQSSIKAGHRRSLSNAFITVSQQVDAPPTFASLGCSRSWVHTRSRTPSFFSVVAAVHEYGVWLNWILGFRICVLSTKCSSWY